MTQKDVSEAFDQVAPLRDTMVSQNPIGMWMKEVNSVMLHETFSPGSCLIELGCGPGTDAIGLARRGCKVFGIDISPGMVALARENVAEAAVQDQVVITQGSTSNLLEALQYSPWKIFDGAYANFSLTYEKSLGSLAESLYKVLKPGDSFVCTLPNRVALSEVLIYGLQLKFRKVLWRLQNPLIMDVMGHSLEIHVFSPWQVRDAFAGRFYLRGLIGLPVFLPPSYLHLQYRRLGGGRQLLKWMDTHLAKHYPWNRLGDYIIFKLQRV